jgi:hypothetical protein
VALQQGFAIGEMGFNDKFAVLVRFPLAFGATASRAVEATNDPAVQGLTWKSRHHRGSHFLGYPELENAGLYSAEPPSILIFQDIQI